MTRRIDAYTHVLPEPFFDVLEEEHGFDALGSKPEFLWDIDHRYQVMETNGVDAQVVTLALAPIWRGMDRSTALELTKIANDEVRTLADDHEELIPVGTIPFVDDRFVDEFHRCVDELDMVGIQFFSNVDGRPVDAEEMHPLYDAAAETDVPLWLHPQHHEWHDWIEEYLDHRVFGWPFDTTLALSRLVFSGIVAEYDLDVVSHHGGGMVPFYGPRMGSFFEQRARNPDRYPGVDWSAYEEPIESYFKSFYADTDVGGSAASLDLVVDYFGADNVVFGTDYPFGVQRGEKPVRTNIEAVEELDLEETMRKRIFAGNIETLIS